MQENQELKVFKEGSHKVDDSVKRLAANMKQASKKVVGTRFPKVTSKSLANNLLTLPDCAEGKITLVSIAFARNAQEQIDSWIRPFEREFGGDEHFAIYELPMISQGWKVLSWMIDSGMRGGIPTEKHDNVITFYGDYSDYQEALEMEDTQLAYVFLLDRKGIIRWREQGYATPETEKELIEISRALLG
ncbi:hypothetical protein MSMTP_1608 [Methanosarcina sp. MTP4]|uniref:hypothetical protein n=1 Tax=Methanosarcina sp. MTP4 TaxID=1434100 RepID=UPI000615643B|nr:hypothetical protein [Methanosarcina sp. MTP4]AKB25077.1 hypothetical protein MSMTP_1608 [Methanosarcina sp. MTP4]